MQHLPLTIPAQDRDRAGTKVKPREVRSWLDDLPLLDLGRSARLAHEQLRLMNRQPMPAGARLEILGYFLATYQRLAAQAESGPGSGGYSGALPGPTQNHGALHALVKRLCQDIGFGYKIVVHELVNKNSGYFRITHNFVPY